MVRDKYYLKENKKAFLKPKIWQNFFNSLDFNQQSYFMMVINTGGRINEICHVCWKDINVEEKTLTFRITKVKARLHQKRPEPRTIAISDNLINWLKDFKEKNNLSDRDYFVIYTQSCLFKLMKKKLKEINIENWKDFSSHNLRKTHGNWLKAIGVDGTEIASRLGHDANTMLKHYVSANIFTDEDIVGIYQILGRDLIDRLKGIRNININKLLNEEQSNISNNVSNNIENTFNFEGKF
jgi:integrase